MNRFRIEISQSARRQLRRIDPPLRRRIIDAIDRLAADPFPAGVKRLSTAQPLWRIRVGDYRIVYEVSHAVLRVLILKIGHRRDVYRGI